jgi:hypothetical protein
MLHDSQPLQNTFGNEVNKQGSELPRLVNRARLRASSCLMVRRLCKASVTRFHLALL